MAAKKVKKSDKIYPFSIGLKAKQIDRINRGSPKKVHQFIRDKLDEYYASKDAIKRMKNEATN